MKTPHKIVISQSSIKLIAYRGIGMVLLAYDLPENLMQNLAGFAIRRTSPDGKTEFLPNQISFLRNYSESTVDKQEKLWFSSETSPFQKLRWLDVPTPLLTGKYRYEIIPTYFNPDSANLKAGPSASLEVELYNNHPNKLDIGFTRGYLSSQAYAKKFQNTAIRPDLPKTINFDTKPFEAKYKWLGGKARKMMVDFLAECSEDPSIEVRAMIYDCDMPDFIDSLKFLGPRVKAIIDNASLHTKKINTVRGNAASGDPSAETQTENVLEAAGAEVVRGHFNRFQHNKVLIQLKKDPVSGNLIPQKVLTGSANFSVRGFYVQANNVLVIDDKDVANHYYDYFNQVFTEMKNGKSGQAIANKPITQQWFDCPNPELPKFSVCFSPHDDSGDSLTKVLTELNSAESSVLFAVMNIGGGGDVLKFLNNLDANENKKNLFYYGIIQNAGKDAEGNEDEDADNGTIEMKRKNQTEEEIVSFSYLKGKVPHPFQEEISGGMGQVIHDKFIVVDFNSSNPVVFTGSSNLSSGGEEANGDNLLAIYDDEIVTAFAVEAVRLFDHYNFRTALKKTDDKNATATTPKPICLKETSAEWLDGYQDPANRKYRDRKFFIK